MLGLKSGKMIKEFRGIFNKFYIFLFKKNKKIKGHTNYITCMILQEDGQRIVSGAIDGMIKFWNYAT